MGVCEGMWGWECGGGMWGWECGGGSVGVGVWGWGEEAGSKRGWENVEVNRQIGSLWLYRPCSVKQPALVLVLSFLLVRCSSPAATLSIDVLNFQTSQLLPS